MWIYEKKLQYPVKIKNSNPALAKLIISQYGGPHGEIGASLRYLSQRYAMPYPELRAILTDVGSEASEMVHSEASAFFDAFIAPFTLCAIANCHLYGSIFKYTSMWSLSFTTILSSSCV